MADDSVGLVKSSYDDVNTALENLLGNVSAGGSSITMEQVNQAITAAVNSATANLIKSSANDSVNDNVPMLGINKAGIPWMINGATGATEYLATSNGSAGSVTPGLLGISGNAVIQAFLASTPRSDQCTVTFPTAFAPNTTPFVMCGNVTETGNTIVSLNSVNQNNDGSLQITNTSFNFYRSTGGAGSINGDTVPVLAIGVM